MPESAGPKIPYEEAVPSNWDTAVTSFVLDRSKRLLTGDCPRCRHPFVKDLSPMFGHGINPSKKVYDWRCNCEVGHGAPEGKRGCGAYGAFKVTL